MLRRIPLHPLLIGAAPVLRLWALNGTEVTADQALPVLAWVLAGVLVVLVVAWAALRDLGRASLVASSAALLVLSYGYLLGDLLPTPLALAGTGVLFVVAVVWVVRADDKTAGTAALGTNVLSVVLVLASLFGVVAAVANELSGRGAPDGADLLADIDHEPTRDIFYIVPDRYARADVIAEDVGYDNRPFLDFLEEQRFEVIDRARSNYPKTAHSLASTMGLDYLDELSTSVPADARDTWHPLYRALRDHRLGQVLTAAGYEYIHVGTWWAPTSTAVAADDVRNYETLSEFADVFLRTTAVSDVLGLFGTQEPLSVRDRAQFHGEFQLQQLDRLASEVDDHTDQPRFVFMHIALPHEPYVFDADGSVVTGQEAAGRTREENYARQLQYLNSRLRPVIEQLVDQPEETAPIVVLQADEGRHPARLREMGDREYAWGQATDAELQGKFRILSAYRLPGVDAASLVREDMTPVNSFRLILDTYLGTELGQLEDRSLVFDHPDDLYTFTDVTGHIDGG